MTISTTRPRSRGITIGLACAALLAGALTSGCGKHQGKVLRLATTTSTRDSGLLDVLIPAFEKQHGCRVDVIAVGTGKALALGESGDVDVVLVHARAAEDAFMAAGHGVRREDVMHNQFEILGPPDDPAAIKGVDPAAALHKIAAARRRFVSRGDDSGTHKKELAVWQAAGGRPPGDWYIEAGQGMGATLTMADQMRGYVLADRGTYLSFKSKIDLVPLAAVTPMLENPYGVMTVNPNKSTAINQTLADAFVDFLIAPATQRMIGDFQVGGETLFHPDRLAGR